MKKIISFVVVFLLAGTLSADAAKDPNKVTAWNRFSDFFATVGKSDHEKKDILKDRKNNRRQSRMFDNKQAAKKKTQKNIQRQNESIMKGVTTKKVPHSRGGIDAR